MPESASEFHRPSAHALRRCRSGRRPARQTQLMSSFAAIWDDVLPPTPDDVWQENLERVVEHLRSGRR
jgi:hypothetical protein